MNDIIYNLKKDGVAVVKNVYTKKQIDTFILNFNTIENNVNTIINSKKEIPTNYNYYTLFDKERCYKKNYYQLNKYNVIELVKSKYNISIKNKHIQKPSPKVLEIIHHFFTKQYSFSWGLLTSSINSNDGPWHRDVVNICGESDKDGRYNDSSMVHNFNPFYFNVLIPLVPLNKENGSTEFILGSHKLTYRETFKQFYKQFDTEIGDVIIFDGRIFHRGRANNSNLDRPVIYNMFHRDWYCETGN